MKEWLLIVLVLGAPLSLQDAEHVYEQYLHNRDLTQDDTITLCYEGLFFLHLYQENNDAEILEKSRKCLDLIIQRQKESGEITNEPNVNPKLYTGVGTWALSLGYEITENELYKNAALKGGDFLIEEVKKWKKVYPVECPDRRNSDARHKGEMKNSLENYCYSCPNDWGMICVGLGSIVHYIGEEGKYREYTLLLGDTLYRMQLENGAWYDGYALKIPTRWNISCHYVTMALLGEWMCYQITEAQKYKNSIMKAVQWMEEMQTSTGVYDIYITEQNIPLEKESFVGEIQSRCDFTQVRGQTNVKMYYATPNKTMLGEYSLLLAETLAEDVGIATNRENTLAYIQNHRGYSHWYILSLVVGEDTLPWISKRNIFLYGFVSIVAVGLIVWIVRRVKKNGKNGKK